MSEKQLQKARKHISRQQYNKARKILQPLAFSNREANQLLQQLNAVAPPVAKSGGRRWWLWGCIGCVGLPIVAVIVIFVLLGIGLNEQQEQAEGANQGRGSKSRPIAAGDTIVFDDFDVTILGSDFPATERVANMNFFNDDPPEGAEYLIYLIQLDCKKEGSDRCTGRDVSFKVIDDTGEEWGEKSFVVLDPDFSTGDSIGGSSFTGWIAFSFPAEGRTVDLVKVSDLFGPTLYIKPPQQE